MDEKPRVFHALIPVVMLILAAMACAQDCTGTSFRVQGYVVDEQNNPIPDAEIRVWYDGDDIFRNHAYEFNTISNYDGYFQTDGVYTYACFDFWVEVSAEGFETTTRKFFPPSGEEWSNQLPYEITVQLQPLEDG